jgi:hypothetical protein
MAKKDKNTIDLPDVDDIPGQEHVRPPRLGELADTTASSADEEGDDVLNPKEDEEDELVPGAEADVTAEERSTLANLDRWRADPDSEVLVESALDNTDNDGEPLNEKGLADDEVGDDLDVPGAEEDDAEEELGEEDEENNDYSLSDEDDHEELEDYGPGGERD